MKVAAATLLLFFLPSLAAPQSMEEASRKEKERQKSVEQAGGVKSFSNDDLPERKAGTSGATTAPPAPLPSAEPDRSRERAQWQKSLADARARLDRAKRQYDAVKNIVALPHAGGYYPVESTQARVQKAKDELERAQQALDSLLDTARRKNLPADWLRP